MIRYIDLGKSKQYDLPFFGDEQAKDYSSPSKGWSFSYVYHFVELKNVFIAIKKFGYQGKELFSEQAIRSKLPFVKTPWDSRRILEQLNALKNFGLISPDYKITENFFPEAEYQSLLTDNDTLLFGEIYHNYFRFKEIHSWLIDPHQDNHKSFLERVNSSELRQRSKPIFPFSIDSRFSDAFIFDLTSQTDVFRIPKGSGDLMRFWDVYVKWGQELKLIEKFNLRNLDYELSNNPKSFACVYYINPERPKINLLDFIKQEYHGKQIHIPQLILKIALRYRYPVEEIKKMVLDQALADGNSFTLQRTSEIFIRDTEIRFVPKFRDSYISHLLLQ